MSFCHGFVGKDSAEDVVNQAMLQAIVALRRGDNPQSLKPWLFTITRRCAIDMLRNSSRQNSLRTDKVQSAGPSHVVEQRETVRSLMRVLGHLPSHERHALVARELRGSSYEEIADELGRSVGAVRQMIYRARVVVRSGVAALLPFLPRHGGGGASSAVMTSSSLAILGAGLSAATLVTGGPPSDRSNKPVGESRASLSQTAKRYPGGASPRITGLPEGSRKPSPASPAPSTPASSSESSIVDRATEAPASSQRGDAPKPHKSIHASHKPSAQHKPANGNGTGKPKPHRSALPEHPHPGRQNDQAGPSAQNAAKAKIPASALEAETPSGGQASLR